jgi:hypothetical protein
VWRTSARNQTAVSTTGPSETRVSGVSNTGVAAHITGARPDGARYDPNLARDERASFDNGLWLCQTHAKSIDDDEKRFTPELLRGWRSMAERLARSEQTAGELSDLLVLRELVPHERQLPPDVLDLRGRANEFLCDVGAPRAWGEHYELVRMLVYELALNAITHGAARELLLNSESGVVTLWDDGHRFGIDDLRRSGQGGNRALLDLERDAEGTFSLMYREHGNRNEWSLVDHVLTGGKDTPCGLDIRHPQVTDIAEEVAALEGCPEIHLYPQTLWSYSDWYPLLRHLAECMGEKVLVVHRVARSPQLVRLVRELAPGARVAD